jgi:hypothetical protein
MRTSAVDRPKRYTLNNYNLGSNGELRRGSLEKDDGIEIREAFIPSRHRYGWIPSTVKMQLLGKNVRFALDWRAPYRHETGLVRLYGGVYFHQRRASIEIPFGWCVRRDLSRDYYVVGPWWHFLSRDIADAFYRARDHFRRFAKRHGAIEGPDGGFWSDHRWWPAQRWDA